ncbi:Cyclin C-terminal domain [Arabidopsis thaliana x Arabidopsis arenosa]|uniref:Cyclin C-terminal domain n=1 Tax=Arabidopsis thaliana x Arabidopsis arenosa TaxID=1240361 RepID=A0A8T1ZM66_9BRAS|nr:Cyclin C-terminal domain [Arabidopsis thaliana x Arabidopsis arenosa]
MRNYIYLVTETPEEQVPEQPLELIPQEEARGTSPRAATGTDSTRGGKYTLMLSMLMFCIQDHVYQEEQALGVANMDLDMSFKRNKTLVLLIWILAMSFRRNKPLVLIIWTFSATRRQVSVIVARCPFKASPELCEQLSPDELVPEQQLQQTPQEEHVFQEEQAPVVVGNMDFVCYEEASLCGFSSIITYTWNIVARSPFKALPEFVEQISPDEQLPEQQLQQIPIEEQALGVADMVFGCYEPGDYTAMLVTKQLTTNPITAIDENTRAITVDTMLASEKASMYPNAIHLAVLVFDQYFATLPLDQGQAAVDPQTAITMALFIAVKYEYGIDKSTRMTFPIRDLDMEMQILSSFNYRLTTPTTKTFVDLYLSLTDPHDATFRFLCSYITELSLLDRECSVFDPSLLATACVFLAEFVLHPDVLPTRVFPWEYSADDVRHAVMFLHAMLVGRRHQICRFTRTRYASVRFGSVASLPCRDLVPEQFFA